MKNIIIKPYITEKTERLSEQYNRYTFIVNKKANKIEIQKAIKEMYNVEPIAVNTMIMPAKAKNRMTRGGLIKGRVASFKKAIVSIADGEELDIYGDL